MQTSERSSAVPAAQVGPHPSRRPVRWWRVVLLLLAVAVVVRAASFAVQTPAEEDPEPSDAELFAGLDEVATNYTMDARIKLAPDDAHVCGHGHDLNLLCAQRRYGQPYAPFFAQWASEAVRAQFEAKPGPGEPPRGRPVPPLLQPDNPDWAWSRSPAGGHQGQGPLRPELLQDWVEQLPQRHAADKAHMALCTVARTEPRVLEWVVRNWLMGVDLFYVIDVGTDEEKEFFPTILQPLVDQGLVNLVRPTAEERESIDRGSRFGVCAARLEHRAEWAAVVDIDDYVTVESSTLALPQYLRGLKEAGVAVSLMRIKVATTAPDFLLDVDVTLTEAPMQYAVQPRLAFVYRPAVVARRPPVSGSGMVDALSWPQVLCGSDGGAPTLVQDPGEITHSGGNSRDDAPIDVAQTGCWRVLTDDAASPASSAELFQWPMRAGVSVVKYAAGRSVEEWLVRAARATDSAGRNSMADAKRVSTRVRVGAQSFLDYHSPRLGALVRTLQRAYWLRYPEARVGPDTWLTAVKQVLYATAAGASDAGFDACNWELARRMVRRDVFDEDEYRRAHGFLEDQELMGMATALEHYVLYVCPGSAAGDVPPAPQAGRWLSRTQDASRYELALKRPPPSAKWARGRWTAMP